MEILISTHLIKLLKELDKIMYTQGLAHSA